MFSLNGGERAAAGNPPCDIIYFKILFRIKGAIAKGSWHA